ncbi:heterokaryon incompatibility protein-domain-containing protein [Xylaria grammica]|nr:heterokaryon incompatibility protein-domain-containing protein [Xylaria grammica]
MARRLLEDFAIKAVGLNGLEPLPAPRVMLKEVARAVAEAIIPVEEHCENGESCEDRRHSVANKHDESQDRCEDEEYYEEQERQNRNEPARKYAYQADAIKARRGRNIRLLELLPGHPSDDVHCVLTTHALSPGIKKYEALSYVWGSAEVTKPIYVNGDSLQVTVNLRSALRHLRWEHESRVLWVDAVCIDQSDLDERAHQVTLMSDIYRSTERVIVWLGRSDQDTKYTFTLLKALAEEAEEVKNAPAELGRKKMRKVRAGVDQARKITHLLENDWFQRSWTVQEILLAREGLVVCGWESIDWKAFFQAIMYASQQEMVAPAIGHFAPFRRDFDDLYLLQEASEFLKRPRESHEQLLELLRIFRARNATDKRDKIYAFLGLISDTDKMGITTDYRMSIGEVYRVTAAELILRSRSLDLLRFLPSRGDDGSTDGAFHRFHDGSELPSWAPSWDYGHGAHPLPFHDGHHRVFRTTSVDAGDIQISADRTILTVAGYISDEISDVTEYLHSIYEHLAGNMLPEEEDEDALWRCVDSFYKAMGPLETLVQWEAFAGFPEEAPDVNETKGALVDGYWQTLCAGVLLPEGKAETRAAFWEWYHTMDPIRKRKRRWYNDFPSFTNLMTMLGHLRAIWARFTRFDRLLGVAFYRRLARTKSGRLALVPRTARVGDGIMLCRVSDFPLIVRKMENQETWRFLGPAYVHGEIFDASLCQPMRFE